MKKQYIYSTLILTAVLTAGCAKENENLKLNDDNSSAIELSSVSTDPMTKAVITGTSFTTDEAVAGIGLFLLDGDGDAYGSNPTNVKYAFSSDKWTAASPLRVGNMNGTLYGYYPYSSSIADITAIPVSSSVNGTDWLYAAPVEVKATNAKSVSLSLSHALARVSLSFRLDRSYAGDGKLSEISLSGDCVAASGTLNATDGSINATTSKFTTGTQQSLSKSTATTLECLVVPVSASGTPEFTVSCIIDGKLYSKTFTGDIAALTQGNQTSVEFTVLNTSIEVDGSSIGVWGDGGSQTVTVGGDYKVTVKLSDAVEDEGISDEVWIKATVVGTDVVIIAGSISRTKRLKCTMSDGGFCTSQGKTGNMVYTFTISDITENTTATIGYAKAVSSIAISPENSGSVEIIGNAYEGETVTLKAIPEYEYGFDAWLDGDGNPLTCEDETYSNARLTNGMSVKFKKNLILSGEFTITRVTYRPKKVRFTRGNLYYDAQGCKVEQHQYDFNAADYSSDHVSHFTWCDRIDYASLQQYNRDLLDIPPTTFFTEQEDFSVYGLNSSECKPRTLTTEEWYALFSYATYDNDARRDKYKSGVTICGKTNCVVLLPDNSELKANDIKDSYSYDEWKHMEDAGAVCLPAAGLREAINGTITINEAGNSCHYWTASTSTSYSSIYPAIYFGDGTVFNRSSERISSALSVRLVVDATK